MAVIVILLLMVHYQQLSIISDAINSMQQVKDGQLTIMPRMRHEFRELMARQPPIRWLSEFTPFVAWLLCNTKLLKCPNEK